MSALTKRSPVPFACRNAELRSGSVVDLAAEDRRLVDLRAVEPAADLRIRAHAFGGAVDGDLRLLGADQELHLQGRGLTRAQRDVLELFVAESRLGHADRVGPGQRQRRNGGAAIASRDGLAHGAGGGVHHRNFGVLHYGAGLIDHDDDHRRGVGRLRDGQARKSRQKKSKG